MTLLMSRPSKGYWTARNFLTIFMQDKFLTNIAKEIIQHTQKLKFCKSDTLRFSQNWYTSFFILVNFETLHWYIVPLILNSSPVCTSVSCPQQNISPFGFVFQIWPHLYNGPITFLRAYSLRSSLDSSHLRNAAASAGFFFNLLDTCILFTIYIYHILQDEAFRQNISLANLFVLSMQRFLTLTLSKTAKKTLMGGFCLSLYQSLFICLSLSLFLIIKCMYIYRTAWRLDCDFNFEFIKGLSRR